MIAHILKKDVSFLWPLVALIVVLKVAAAWAIIEMGIFVDYPDLAPIHGLIELGCSALACFAIIRAVHADPVVSDTADWLIRPIGRLDLLVAKALFAAVVTFLPVFVISLGVGLVNGWGFADSVTRSFRPAVEAFLILGLPALAMGAITANSAQAIGTIAGVLILWVLAILVQMAMVRYVMLPGESLWFVQLVQVATIIGAAGVIIGLQYWRRRTGASRCIFAAAVAVLIVTIVVPWNKALQLQRLLHEGASDGPVRIRFDAQAPIGGPAAPNGRPTLYIPLKAEVDEGAVANIDALQLKLESADGQVVYDRTVAIAVTRGDNELRRLFDATSVSPEPRYFGAMLSRSDYDRFKDQTLRATLTYHFTAYQAGAPIKAVLQPSQRRAIKDVGICETRQNRINPAFTDMFCFPAADQPACFGGSVRHLDTGRVERFNRRCLNAFRYFGVNPRGIVTPGRLAAAYPTPPGNVAVEISLTPYKRRSHYTQTVVLPAMRLGNLSSRPGT
jgi:hypothetical protein